MDSRKRTKRNSLGISPQLQTCLHSNCLFNVLWRIFGYIHHAISLLVCFDIPAGVLVFPICWYEEASRILHVASVCPMYQKIEWSRYENTCRFLVPHGGWTRSSDWRQYWWYFGFHLWASSCILSESMRIFLTLTSRISQNVWDTENQRQKLRRCWLISTILSISEKWIWELVLMLSKDTMQLNILSISMCIRLVVIQRNSSFPSPICLICSSWFIK